mmetsp:Transcript_10045/g.29018  ORF Transcript_10045/g.29018 Transcript_10045/m.29018 type:complete len:275 (-) Transcript_10045:1711-2535(-)
MIKVRRRRGRAQVARKEAVRLPGGPLWTQSTGRMPCHSGLKSTPNGSSSGSSRRKRCRACCRPVTCPALPRRPRCTSSTPISTATDTLMPTLRRSWPCRRAQTRCCRESWTARKGRTPLPLLPPLRTIMASMSKRTRGRGSRRPWARRPRKRRTKGSGRARRCWMTSRFSSSSRTMGGVAMATAGRKRSNHQNYLKTTGAPSASARRGKVQRPPQLLPTSRKTGTDGRDITSTRPMMTVTMRTHPPCLSPASTKKGKRKRGRRATNWPCRWRWT